MTRINTNVQNLVAKRTLDTNNDSLTTSLRRLSTGLRINTGKDDPAGLIASEGLRASKVAITAAVDNARRAEHVVGIAEAGLGEINALLLELEDLVDKSANEAGLSNDERDANQLQIDTVLSSINRIAGTTAFNGEKLLDGNYAFMTSGVNSSKLASLQINAARVPDGSSRSVTVQVLGSAQTAQITGTVTGLGTSQTNGVTTIEVRGEFGTEVLSFASGTSVAAMATAINASKELTGVSATTINAATGSSTTTLRLYSTDFGSDSLVQVRVLNGDFTPSTTLDYGQDPTVSVNGQSATMNGLEGSVRSGNLEMEFYLSGNFATHVLSASTFAITGGGARFSISPDVGLIGQETIGFPNINAGSLGNPVVGYLSSLGRGEANDIRSRNFGEAQRILREAQDQVSSLRGRIGAFQKDTLQTTVNSLLIAFENTAAAESAIRDTDFAVETSSLSRAQILVQTNIATLQMANQLPQNALALLGG